MRSPVVVPPVVTGASSPTPRAVLCRDRPERWDDAVDAAGRFAVLVDAFSEEPGVTPPGATGRRAFGSEALKVDGAIFAMQVQGEVVVKLPAARVAELVGAGTCAPFANGRGSPMREWAAVTDPSVDLELTREALAFVRSGRP